ncbi:MAG: AraC family transcriptional regulator [Oscillospiraceae bacterium]|nr:AraC family transcriptional regulator [Oscillospiraceae bacterium]
MDWVKRMNAVLDYIEENLDGEIDDDRIALLYASPKGMFQRIFANITDMTLAEYIRKRRLTQAAFDIRHTDEKIIDIAIKYGYNSAVAFSSAFKNFHGITPSEARTGKTKSFQRLAFTFILSEKGVTNMNENAQYLLKQMIDKEGKSELRKYLRNVSEHNGVICACDGNRAAVILPEGVDDWDLSDAYFEADDGKFELSTVFNKKDSFEKFNLSKEQAAVSFVSLSIEGSKDNIVCIDVSTMEISKNTAKRIMGFNVKYIEEGLKFIMCSDDSNIEIYYGGSLNQLIIKSGRLYTAVLPVVLR